MMLKPSLHIESADAPGVSLGGVVILVCACFYQAIIGISEGLFQYELVLCAIPMIVICFGVFLLPSFNRREVRQSVALFIVAAACEGQILTLFWSKHLYYFSAPTLAVALVPITHLALVLLIGWVAITSKKWGKWILLVAAIIQLSTLFFVVRHSTSPRIDVYMFHQDSAKAILEGQNPYAITFKNPYLEPDGSPSRFYSRQVQHGDRLAFGFPYPPMSLWMYLPSYWLTGESRYAHAGALVLAGLGIGWLSRERISSAAALVLMTAPAQWVLIENAWTEPFILVSLVAVAVAALKARWLLPVALGIFFATKQYNIIFLPLLWLILPRPLCWKSSLIFVGKIVLTGAVVSLPLAVWDWQAFWNSNVTIQMNQPFRFDAFSYLAMLANSIPATFAADGTKIEFDPPTWWSMISFGLLLPTWIILLWRLPRHVGGFVAGVALTSIVFLFSNRQAFLNYHSFAAGALVLAVACIETMRRDEIRADSAQLPDTQAA